tara:strand:+ start:18370 stop:19380 length:1011 start_codon:yes stop_codon:yes gene_type:complete
MVKCLVTGGCGFIGSNLVLGLHKKGWSVDVVDDMSNGYLDFLDSVKPRTVHADLLHLYEEEHEDKHEINPTQVLVITGDFAHDNVLNRVKSGIYDYVFHMAALPRVEHSVDDPVATTETNLFKTIALFQVSVGNTRRVIFSSSSSVYGDAQIFPTPETMEKDPQSPYALQKLCGEYFAELFHKLYGMKIVSLRYFNVYGPHQYGDSPYSTAIGAWCHATKNNLPLRSDGDGTQVRDMVFVDDVVNANILAATTKDDVCGNVFNVGYGESCSNNEILEIFKNKFNDIKIKHAPWRPGDVMKTLADTSLAQEKLGYTPQTNLAAGLEKTFAWWGLEEN